MKGGGRLRIIGGTWRGRRLPVPDLPGLRPTPDRVRETLFNWLAAEVPGSRCLDLFAGTGALGLEAASRGADMVTLVERAGAAVAHLRRSVELLGASRVTVVQADARAWLRRAAGAGAPPFDIAFLDPPYDRGLLRPTLEALAAAGCLAPDARVYLEDRNPDLPLPPGWDLIRSGHAGQVHFGLAAPGPAP